MDGLSISNVKMKLSEIFRNLQNGRHFEVRRTFKPEVVPEVESYSKIGHTTPYILRFCLTLKLKYWQSYGYLKIWPSFQPDDVIDDVINTKKYTPIARCKFHICAKFGVDCLNGATSIVNITDPQTDRQTVRRTYLPNFWQVINRCQKWIERVQNSPIPLIRGRRLRIWSQIKATSNSLNFHKMAAMFMSN